LPTPVPLIGALHQAAAGAPVLVVAERHQRIPELLHAARAYAGADPDIKIRRSAGNEQITFTSGGRIRFMTVRQVVEYSAARGHSVKHLYLPAAARFDQTLNRELIPCTASHADASITYTGELGR
jgi:hypothetical protein